jgi:hypothetical protein
LIGIINRDIVSITDPYGCEFIVHLRKRAADTEARSKLAERRELLLRWTADELAHASRYGWKLRAEAAAPRRKLFTIHIPQTAGETFNHLFTRTFGGENVRTHVENMPNFLEKIGSVPSEVRYVSGHLGLPEVLRNIDRQARFTFILLRNPVQHLISDLSSVRSLGAPDAEAQRRKHDKITQEIAVRLWEISLNDVNDAYRLINEGFDESRQLFDNCQVRYLIGYRDRFVSHADAGGGRSPWRP